VPGNFAKRYSGFFNAVVTSTYKFSLTSDDGSYLWLDGNPTAFINNSAVATADVPCGGHRPLVCTLCTQADKRKQLNPGNDALHALRLARAATYSAWVACLPWCNCGVLSFSTACQEHMAHSVST